MPKISFAKPRAAFDVPVGTNLMEALLDQGIPVASSCGGEGVCAKCRVRVSAGKENLSKPGPVEEDLKDLYDLSSDERISCQTLVNGDITIDTRYW